MKSRSDKFNVCKWWILPAVFVTMLACSSDDPVGGENTPPADPPAGPPTETPDIHIYAHRGRWSMDSSDYLVPENSITGIQKAALMGYEGIECDVK